jgi:hypothetical protein
MFWRFIAVNLVSFNFDKGHAITAKFDNIIECLPRVRRAVWSGALKTFI